MSSFYIQLSVQADNSGAAGLQLDPVSTATIEFFDNFQPSSDSETILFNPADGLDFKDFVSAPSFGIGELRCISQACVSDIHVFDGLSSLVNPDPTSLANTDLTGIANIMNEQISFDSLNAELMNAIPRMQHALDGSLTYSELSQLISDIQAQVLDLNGLSQDVFDDLSADVNQAMQEFAEIDSSTLLNSMQIDTSLFAAPGLASNAHGLAFEATLDGLFTSPEAFPLTLDFSNADRIQEASELFASTGGMSSISSTANASDTEGGLVSGNIGGSDLS